MVANPTNLRASLSETHLHTPVSLELEIICHAEGCFCARFLFPRFLVLPSCSSVGLIGLIGLIVLVYCLAAAGLPPGCRSRADHPRKTAHPMTAAAMASRRLCDGVSSL